MKKNIKRMLYITLAAGFLMTGCSKEENKNASTDTKTIEASGNGTETTQVPFTGKLEVSFGQEGEPFTMNLYDNETARAISGYVGTSDWNLPIYHYDDYENYEVMQYYDIPDHYEIPSDQKTVTSQKAGEVYYSEPNRIVLFYKDAQITGEYTRLGYFDATGAFVSAVENNPVVEGWSNKLVCIRPAA